MVFSLKIIALTLIVMGVGVVVGTGAFTTIDAERTASIGVAGDSSALLQLTPYAGPDGNGQYAQITDGTIEIGDINVDAATDIPRVFNITNQGTQPVGVWITDIDNDDINYTSKITFYNPIYGGGAGLTNLACENGVKSLEGSVNAAELETGETLVVSIMTVTDGVSGTNEDLLDKMIIHASANVDGVTGPTDISCSGVSDGGSSGTSGNVDLVTDFDGDGIDDATEEGIDTDPNNADTDGDGIDDYVETTKTNGDGPGYEVDTDGDGTIDALDADSDGDGILDATEGADDADGDGTANYRDLDSDGDGILDATEGTDDDDGDGVPNYLDVESNDEIEVDIDVKPGNGNETDPINPNSPGVTPVVVYTTDEFDASSINVSSLRFGAPDVVDAGKGASTAHNGHLEDVDGDGDIDLMLHFPTPDSGFESGDTEAKLVGRTTDGDSLSGNDEIRIVGGGPT